MAQSRDQAVMDARAAGRATWRGAKKEPHKRPSASDALRPPSPPRRRGLLRQLSKSSTTEQEVPDAPATGDIFPPIAEAPETMRMSAVDLKDFMRELDRELFVLRWLCREMRLVH